MKDEVFAAAGDDDDDDDDDPSPSFQLYRKAPLVPLFLFLMQSTKMPRMNIDQFMRKKILPVAGRTPRSSVQHRARFTHHWHVTQIN